MSEPDHLLVKPVPNLSNDGLGAAFPFFYIEPKKYETVLRKFFPKEKGPITNIDPIGNSPVIVRKVTYAAKKIWASTLPSFCILRWTFGILYFTNYVLGCSEKDSSDLDECFLGNEERS